MRSKSKAKRPERDRTDKRGVSGVASAQKVLAALQEKHDPPKKK